MVLRGRGEVVSLCVLLLVGVVTAQNLEKWLDLRGEGFGDSWSRFSVRASYGWNAPYNLRLYVQEKGEHNTALLEEPETTVFTAGALKRDADRKLSKVFVGYDTAWGKQFVYNDPRFQAVITFVEASSKEIGVHLKISRSDYFIDLEYRDVLAGTTNNYVEYELHDLASRSNLGTPGEYAFVLSRRSEIAIYGPSSPVPYSNYHAVATPASPRAGFKSPRIAGIPLSYSAAFPGLRGRVQGEVDGAAYTDSAYLLVGGSLLETDGPAPSYLSRSLGSQDMEYIAGLTSVVSSSYTPVEALFVQLSQLSGSSLSRSDFDIDLQLIYTVDSAGRPAMILNIGERRDVTPFPSDWKVRFLNERSFRGDAGRGYRYSNDINLGRDFDRKSNVGIPGTWVFLVSEDFTELLDNVGPIAIENPSLYKFCSQDNVEAVLEADDITKKTYVNMGSLGWNGKWRKKSLRYLLRDEFGMRLSHYRGYEIEKAKELPVNYRLLAELGSYGNSEGLKMTLQRICVVGDAGSMQQIARDTAAAGFDSTRVPEKAIVLEYEIRKEALPGEPSYTFEQVFASYSDRETIASISNFPPAALDRTEFYIRGATECSSHNLPFMTNDLSNTEQDGRIVVVFDSSEKFMSIRPAGARLYGHQGCDDYAGPCDGECPAGFLCQVHNSKNFCVNCRVFQRNDEDQSECCKLNLETNQCKNNIDSRLEKCLVADPDSFQMLNREKLVLPVTYPPSVCKHHRNFFKNGGACRLLDTFNANGERKCYFPRGRFF